jgi:hypothetical protein
MVVLQSSLDGYRGFFWEGITMRYLRALLNMLPGILAAIFIGTTMTLLVLFPRVMNELADVMGTVPTALDTILHIVIAVAIDALLFYLAFVRPWQHARQVWDNAGLIVRKGQGRAYMDIESVRQQIYTAVARVPEIQRTEVLIDNENGRAAVRVSVVTSPSINAPRKKADLRREIHKVLEDQLGIDVAGEPSISISLAPLPEERPVITTPRAELPPPVAPRAPTPLPEPVLAPRPAPTVTPVARPIPASVSTSPTPLPTYPAFGSRPITPRATEPITPPMGSPASVDVETKDEAPSETHTDAPDGEVSKPEYRPLGARLFGHHDEPDATPADSEGNGDTAGHTDES